MYELLLISASPRRRQILSDAGYLFRFDSVKISEIIEENVNVRAAIMNLARAKGQAYIDKHNPLKPQKILMLSADTVVVLANKALGKPGTDVDAHKFLGLLSGKKHSVITAIYLLNLHTGEEILTADETLVEFRELSKNEIMAYVKSGEPFDKAGAYAIQGEGKKFVKQISGSLQNVIGLPLELFEKILAEKGWDVCRKS